MFTFGIFKQALRTNLWLGEIWVSLEVIPRSYRFSCTSEDIVARTSADPTT